MKISCCEFLYSHIFLSRLWQGKVPIISLEGLHQLHIFIFVLTVVHVGYSCVTVFLGFYKVSTRHLHQIFLCMSQFANDEVLQECILPALLHLNIYIYARDRSKTWTFVANHAFRILFGHFGTDDMLQSQRNSIAKT
jgi:hypothetical protein